jgi:hypothetical protein
LPAADERLGYVTRANFPDSNKLVRVFLTPKGRGIADGQRRGQPRK